MVSQKYFAIVILRTNIPYRLLSNQNITELLYSEVRPTKNQFEDNNSSSRSNKSSKANKWTTFLVRLCGFIPNNPINFNSIIIIKLSLFLFSSVNGWAIRSLDNWVVCCVVALSPHHSFEVQKYWMGKTHSIPCVFSMKIHQPSIPIGIFVSTLRRKITN